MASSGRYAPSISRVVLTAPVFAASVLVSGCLGSPTYGTDKTATEQLATDLTSVLSLAPAQKEKIDYNPRPELVRPAKGSATLPPPQESITKASADAWPESPEQKLARVRKNSDANRNNPNYEPIVYDDIQASNAAEAARLEKMTPQQRQAEFRRRLSEQRQGDPTQRKYLSEPPVVYRQSADSAPVGDIGEDERVKERRMKKAAQKGGSSWTDWLPW